MQINCMLCGHIFYFYMFEVFLLFVKVMCYTNYTEDLSNAVWYIKNDLKYIVS